MESIVASDIFNNIFTCEDATTAWNSFKQEFLSICDNHAPIQEYRVKTIFNPWFSPHILNLIYKRNYAHKLAVQNNDLSSWNNYRKLRNLVTKTIRKEKSKYYTEKINSFSNNSTHMWKTLKGLLPSNRNTFISSDIDADCFNKYFSSIGQQLAANFGDLVLPEINVTTNIQFNFTQINYITGITQTSISS